MSVARCVKLHKRDALRLLAKDAEIPGYKRMNKSQICKVLKLLGYAGISEDASSRCKRKRVPQLKQLAKLAGLRGYSKLKKADLCRILMDLKDESVFSPRSPLTDLELLAEGYGISGWRKLAELDLERKIERAIRRAARSPKLRRVAAEISDCDSPSILQLYAAARKKTGNRKLGKGLTRRQLCHMLGIESSGSSSGSASPLKRKKKAA